MHKTEIEDYIDLADFYIESAVRQINDLFKTITISKKDNREVSRAHEAFNLLIESAQKQLNEVQKGINEEKTIKREELINELNKDEH